MHITSLQSISFYACAVFFRSIWRQISAEILWFTSNAFSFAGQISMADKFLYLSLSQFVSLTCSYVDQLYYEHFFFPSNVKFECTFWCNCGGGFVIGIKLWTIFDDRAFHLFWIIKLYGFLLSLFYHKKIRIHWAIYNEQKKNQINVRETK